MSLRDFVVAVAAASLAVAGTLGLIATIKSYREKTERTMNSE